MDLYGGWESEEIIESYVNYAKTLFKAYGSKVKYWITFNENKVFYITWMAEQHKVTPESLTIRKHFIK